jgi:UDP-4-amino-4,6-dideoxy-N-acetyl-beta-L-altrosamine N-acetyltransferase
MVNKFISLANASNDLIKEVLLWRNSSQVTKYFILENIDEKTHFDWIENKIKKNKDFAMIMCHEDEAVGCVYIRNIDKKNKIAEFGIFLKPGAPKNKGLGTVATYKMLEYSFEELHLEKVFLEVLDFNIGAIALYEKFNFKIEGRLKKHIVKENQRVDLLIMSLFFDDWVVVKASHSKIDSAFKN